MEMPKEFIELAASVARGRSPVLIDAVASGQSYLLSLLEQSGQKQKVTVDLPEELDVDHVSVEMTWFDEESSVVRVAPLRIQKRPEGNLTSIGLDEDDVTSQLTPMRKRGSTGLDEDETKRLKRLQEMKPLLDSDTDSYEEVTFQFGSDESVESEKVLEELGSVTKEWEEDDFSGYKGIDLGIKGPLASWSASDVGSTLSAEIDVVPAKSLEEKDKGLFRLMIGGEKDLGTTDLKGQVALCWNLRCAWDTDKIVLSMDSFSPLAAKGSKYFLTQWDMEILGQDGWLPESWSPKDRRTDGRVVGTQSSHVTLSSVASVSEVALEAGIEAGRSRRFQIDHRQRPWWVGAGPTLFGVSGVGWMWKTTAWSDMSKRTKMQEDVLSVRYCRGKVSPTKLTIELVPEEKPEAVFRNKNNPQPVPVFDIKTTAMYRYPSKLPGRSKFKEMRKNFRVVVVS